MMKFAIVLLCILRYSRCNRWPTPMSKKVCYPFIRRRSGVETISESVFSLAALESKLVAYVKDPAAAEQPFDCSSVPKISRAQAAAEAARKNTYLDVGFDQELINIHLQVPALWRRSGRHRRRRQSMHLPLLQQRRHSPNMPSNYLRSPSSPHMGLSLTAAPRPQRSQKAKPSTRLTVSSTSTKSILYSRCVDCCVFFHVTVLMRGNNSTTSRTPFLIPFWSNYRSSWRLSRRILAWLKIS